MSEPAPLTDEECEKFSAWFRQWIDAGRPNAWDDHLKDWKTEMVEDFDSFMDQVAAKDG